MDNLHAEKFTIGGNEPSFSYDGSGINPDSKDDVRYEGDPADVYTFEDEPVDEVSEVSKEELTKTVVEKTEEDTEEDGTDYTNILLIGGLLLALLFYKKK